MSICKTVEKVRAWCDAGLTSELIAKLVEWCIVNPWPTYDESTIYEERFAGGSVDGTAGTAWGRNSTVTRISAGRWRVTFAAAHPDGVEYHVSVGAEEPANTRDNPKKTVEQGTKSANGFVLMLTVDDNGTAADPYSDQPWSYGVTAPALVVTP